MSDNYLQLRKVMFKGNRGNAELKFTSGVNVICGASDTGKSFLAESIDFMLGGSELREIPERASYAEIEFDLRVSDGEDYRFRRSTSGGNFKLIDLDKPNSSETVLKQNHTHGKSDNLSGFLLEKMGLLGKRILKSSAKGTTQSLSFRNLARLVIVQEDEIQQRGSPFWGGQYTTKTAELATIKLLLTGVDDSAIVSAIDTGADNAKQIALMDELLADLATEIEDIGEERDELTSQLCRLESSIEGQRESLNVSQRKLENLLTQRREALEDQRSMQERLGEIADLLARFDLLQEHYVVDIERLTAIRESGSMFAHVGVIPCPLCGATPEAQHHENACGGDVEAIVVAAVAEIEKIERLLVELGDTVTDLRTEENSSENLLVEMNATYQQLEMTIQETIAPEVGDARSSFSELIEKRAFVQGAVGLFARREKLEGRKTSLQEEGEKAEEEGTIKAGIPESVAHALSKKVSEILKAWDFPGDCHVHFDKQSTDFVIDGKPRGSRGKGLRAITHAAVSVALLEHCQENGLSHPGFVVLDSPLLAYFKPEGDDDLILRGTDLKARFYEYLVTHHGAESQILIIENQHPPETIEDRLSMTIFTGNPHEGRLGLL